MTQSTTKYVSFLVISSPIKKCIKFFMLQFKCIDTHIYFFFQLTVKTQSTSNKKKSIQHAINVYLPTYVCACTSFSIKLVTIIIYCFLLLFLWLTDCLSVVYYNFNQTQNFAIFSFACCKHSLVEHKECWAFSMCNLHHLMICYKNNNVRVWSCVMLNAVMHVSAN